MIGGKSSVRSRRLFAIAVAAVLVAIAIAATCVLTIGKHNSGNSDNSGSSPGQPQTPAVPAECHITTFSNATVKSATSACQQIVVDSLSVPGGTTLDLSGLKDNALVFFRGHIAFAFAEWDGPLLHISGKNITVDGSGATLDGNGPQYWDGHGGNGGKVKPKFFSLQGSRGGQVSNIRVVNSPVQVFSIGSCQNLTVSDIVIDNSAGDNGLAFNTDAFDVGNSDNVLVQRVKVHNQDDCVAVNSGTNLRFSQFDCTGSHGLSIGSVGHGPDDKVENVLFEQSKLSNGPVGLRIKTVQGAKGLVSNITFRDIALSNISSYGVDILQNYLNGGPSGTPTNGIPIQNITLENVSGSVQNKAKQFHILVVLFFGVLFGTADCINNIVMLALGDEYPALIFYLSRLIYQPNPAVLYLSTVYRLLIMIIKPHVCRSLLWFSWTMTIVIQALGFTGFTVNYLAASGDPVLAARPLPVWSTLPSNTLGAAIALKATSGASHGQLQHQPQSQVSQGGPRSYPHPSMPASAHSSEPKSAASRPEWV
ncbi:hypothetical protein RI367_007018 [Sorochytrium milnesiophthora]